MSIDFDKITRQFEKPLLLGQMTPISMLFGVIQGRMKKRKEILDNAIQATQMFPVIMFYGESVSFYIDRSQWGLIPPIQPDPGVLESVKRGSLAFVNGLGRVAEAVQEELIIPTMLDIIIVFTDSIEAAIGRYSVPHKKMFDKQQRGGEDIVGITALLSNAFSTSSSNVNTLHSGVADLVAVARDVSSAGDALKKTFHAFKEGYSTINQDIDLFFPSKKAVTTNMVSSVGDSATASNATHSSYGVILSFSESLCEVTHYFAGALLAIPQLIESVSNILTSCLITIQQEILSLCEIVQNKVIDIRATVIDFIFVTLADYCRSASRFLFVFSEIALIDLRFFLVFGQFYIQSAGDAIRVFLEGLSEFIQYWENFIICIVEGISTAFHTIWDLDLIPFIAGPLLSVTPGAPTLTIGDLLTAISSAALDLLHEKTNDFLLKVEAAILVIEDKGAIGGLLSYADNKYAIRKRISAIRSILNITLTPTDAWLGGGLPPPDFTRFKFPDIYDIFIKSGLKDFKSRLGNMFTELNSTIDNFLSSVSGALYDISGSFSGEAHRAAANLMPAMFSRIASSASEVGELLWGPQIAELQKSISAKSDPLAKSFEDAFTRGGFYFIEAIIPLYIEQLRLFWEQRSGSVMESSPDWPTSPHILSVHARLYKVKMSEMVLRSRGESLDENLVSMFAHTFQVQISKAYQAGNEKFIASMESV